MKHAMARLAQWWTTYWFCPGSLMDLAVCRIVMVGCHLAIILAFQVDGTWARLASLPDALYDPLPALHLLNLPVGWNFRPSGEVLNLIVWVTVSAGLLGLLGWKTNASLVFFAISSAFLAAFRHAFIRIDHRDGLMMIALVSLALSPSGRRLSLDALRRQDSSASTSPFARWPLLLIRWMFALVYLSSAISKLHTAGLAWMNGYTLQFHVLHTALQNSIDFGMWMAQQHGLAVVLSWITIVFEGTFFLVLLLPKLAWLYVPVGIALHGGISLAMGINFFQFIALYAVFVPWGRAFSELLRPISQLSSMRKPIELMPVSHRPIFIIGCERSGTTLLREMLNAHPSIAFPPDEARAFSLIVSTPKPWAREWTRAEAVRAIEEFLAFRKVRHWQLEQAAVLRELGQSSSYGYAEILRAIYGAYAKQAGKPRWGDKTPINTYELPRLIREFPEAQFIHLIRDGRDVYLSWLNAWWVRYDVAAAARRWKEWVWWAYRHGEKVRPNRYYQLRYEDLIRHPREELEKLCRFLREPFAESMLRYDEQFRIPELVKTFHQRVGRPPDSSRVSRWKREMAASDVRTFERIAGATLVKYGYEISPPMRMRAYVRFAALQVKQRAKDVVTSTATGRA